MIRVSAKQVYRYYRLLYNREKYICQSLASATEKASFAIDFSAVLFYRIFPAQQEMWFRHSSYFNGD